ncbi:MAG: hypothetical protein Q4D98_00840 [Planctomycetia bacterium]|nr:hypothetical protein [Planctomycetia bacterium]
MRICFALWLLSAVTVFAENGMVRLPDDCRTPDGMTYNAADGNIYLVVPATLAEGDAPLFVIGPDDQAREIYRIPAHPETKHAGTLGIAFGPDGNLYVADSQEICGHPEHLGRLLRVVFEQGKPVRTEVLATGFIAPNGLTISGNHVYFCETRVTEDTPTPLTSGLFCFALDTLDPKKPYRARPYVSADDHDPHFLFSFQTHDPVSRVGANGCGASADGKIYVANFGDEQIYELTLTPTGDAVKSVREVIRDKEKTESIDGIRVDGDTIYFADFLGNAVRRVGIAEGVVQTLAENPVGTGAGGQLDRCSEVCRRGAKLYVSNIDLPFDNENDPPNTLTILELP